MPEPRRRRGAPGPPQLPRGTPADLRDFVDCKAGSVTLKSGKVDWIPNLPEVEVTLTPGARPGSVEIRVGLNVGGLPISLSLPVTVTGGRLEVDASNVPDLIPGGREGITSWANRLNDWFRWNGKQLAPLEVKDGVVTLTKVAIGAVGEPAVGVPGTPTTTPAPAGAGGGPAVTTPGGPQPQPVAPAPAGPKVTPADVEAQRSRVDAARQEMEAKQKRREELAEEWAAFDRDQKAAKEMGAPLDSQAITRRQKQLQSETERAHDEYYKAQKAFDDETARLRHMETQLRSDEAAPVGPTGQATRAWWQSGPAVAGLGVLVAAGVVGGFILFRGDQAPVEQPQPQPQVAGPAEPEPITVAFSSGETVTYEGPTAVTRGQSFTARLCLRDAGGNPVAGKQVFASLGDPPTSRRATHGTADTDQNGCADIEMEVNWPPGRTVLWFSDGQEVVHGTTMDVRSS
jgi:hypothetical protein